MNLFVTISISLLVILAALFYLLKVKNENHGSFYRLSGMLVLASAAGLFFFLVFKGVKRLIRHDHRDQRAMQYHHEGKKMRMKAKAGNGMHECCDHEECCCKDSAFHKIPEGAHIRTESSTDTVDGKVIRKEIKIIEKEE